MENPIDNPRRTRWVVARWIAVGVFALGLIRTAWVAEDAFITYRTIDNFFNGYGLRWNVSERVQTYSHPLWMIALAVGRGLSGEYYYSTLTISAICSGLAVYALGFRLSPSAKVGACGVLILAFSKSFVDFSTSGLEGPLTHILIALFALLHFGDLPRDKRLLWMTFTASLGVVNRPDLALLFLPAVLFACRGVSVRESIKLLIAGGVPLALWVLFATVYYGTPIPVTGYAKAMTGIAPGEMIGQGLKFYRDLITHDPILLPVLFLGLVVAFTNKSARGVGLGLGALIYCAYLLKIGGGYMGGRFLTPPFFVATILLTRVVVPSRAQIAYPIAMACTLVLGFLCPATPILSPSDYSTRDGGLSSSGVVDERGFWYPRTGLLAATRNVPKPNMLPQMLGLELDPADPIIFLDGLVGLDGFLAGPGVHFVDPMLCDPLLMRLPAWDQKDWRVGHYLRNVPEGYLESVAYRTNAFTHPGLKKAYEDVRQLTRGDIFSTRRFASMWSLAFGAGKRGLQNYSDTEYRNRLVALAQEDDFPSPCEQATSIWNPDFRLVGTGGLLVSLNGISNSRRLEIGLGGMAEYRITFMKAGQSVGELTHYAAEKSKLFPGVFPALLDVPEDVSKSGFDGLKFEALKQRRTGLHCVAYISLDK